MLCVSASIHWVHNTKQQPCLNRPSEFNNTHTTRSVRCSSRHHALCTMHHAPCSMHHAPCIMQHAPCQHRTRSVRCSSRHHVQALASEAHTAVCDGSGACDCVRGPAYEKEEERSEAHTAVCDGSGACDCTRGPAYEKEEEREVKHTRPSVMEAGPVIA